MVDTNPADRQRMSEREAAAILAGWMSRNEAREKENMNPMDGLDVFLEPLNTGPVDGADGAD